MSVASKSKAPKISDEALRIYVFTQMADSDIDGKILAENMEKAFRWIRPGKVVEPCLMQPNSKLVS